jgi:indole-3-glycerol phosphate synthase/phosphoribosylanthranilate isomerase
VIAAAPLSYVGVFRNADIADVVAKAETLSLSAVQLHGDEDQAYIDALRAAWPHRCRSGKRKAWATPCPRVT